MAHSFAHLLPSTKQRNLHNVNRFVRKNFLPSYTDIAEDSDLNVTTTVKCLVLKALQHGRVFADPHSPNPLQRRADSAQGCEIPTRV